MDKTIGYECSSRAPQDQSFYAVEIFCKASINGRVMSREEFFRVKRIQWPTIYGNAAVNARGSVSPNETIVIEVYNQDSVENTTAFIKEIKLDVREDVSIGSRVTVGLWDLVHSNGHKLIYTFWKSPEYKVTCTYSLTEAWSILCQVKLEGRIITSKDKSFYPIRMLPSTPTAIAYTLYGANTKDPGNIGNNTFKVSFDDLGSPFPAPNQTSVDTALQLLKLELLFKSTLGQSKKVSISDLLVR
ncbi:MAG: hypothetical protein EOP04_15940 [Proteobacteria bacterium]|nr:MAG: hypothetical protein EOP04_15940 [Pseudomonadota bacterium]